MIDEDQTSPVQENSEDLQNLRMRTNGSSGLTISGPAKAPDRETLVPAGKSCAAPINERLAFSVAETAEMLGVCEKTVRRLVSRKLLCPSRALRILLIPRTEILKFLRETSSR